MKLETRTVNFFQYCVLAAVASLGFLGPCAVRGAGASDADVPYERRRDVVYGRKFGPALTMDVLNPKEGRNGAAVVFVVNSAFISSQGHIDPALPFQMELLRRGYVVFMVVTSSQPKFTLPEIVTDVHRAVRFIRHHGRDAFGIDPDRIGVTGASAGGMLALYQGVAGELENPSPATADDPVERASSRVRAVACFCPCTDWLNYGRPGLDVTDPESSLSPWLNAAFDFHELDPEKNIYVRITDAEAIRRIKHDMSPINHVSADDPPMLIIHGSVDTAVPIEQSRRFIDKLAAVDVPAQLVVREGESHNWKTRVDDVSIIADWFDKHLKPAGSAADVQE